MILKNTENFCPKFWDNLGKTEDIKCAIMSNEYDPMSSLNIDVCTFLFVSKTYIHGYTRTEGTFPAKYLYK